MEEAKDPEYSYSFRNGVDIWKKKVNGTTWNGIGKTLIKNTTPKHMTKIYCNLLERKKWDHFYTILEDVEILPNNNRIVRTATWVPPFLTTRDYIQVGEIIETEECCIGVYLPAEHEKLPIGKDGNIRGYSNFSGFIFRQIGKDCLCTLMTETDVSIPIPDFVIKNFISVAVSRHIKELREASKKL